MSTAADEMRKKGITSVSDNMKPGEHLNISSGIFMAFFGPALIEHYSKKTKASSTETGNTEEVKK